MSYYYYLKMEEYKKKKWKNINWMKEWFEKQKELFYIKLSAFWKNKLSSVASSATEDSLFNWKTIYKIQIGLHLVCFSILQTRKLFHHVKVVVQVGKVVFYLVFWFCTKHQKNMQKTKKVAWTVTLNCLLKTTVSPYVSIN